jgi:AhpD family alkylhydroperoxidase
MSSNPSTWFAPLSADTAPDGSKGMIAASQKQFGFVASPIAKAAASPPLLKHLLGGFPAFEHSSLSHVEREVLAMTVAYEVGCHYCMAMHSAMAAKEQAIAAIEPTGTDAQTISPHVGALREGRPLADARLEALRLFVREMVQTHAHVSTATWQRFAGAGYTEQNALDVVLGVGVYLLSTYTNIATRSELDAPFAAFAWTK